MKPRFSNPGWLKHLSAEIETIGAHLGSMSKRTGCVILAALILTAVLTWRLWYITDSSDHDDGDDELKLNVVEVDNPVLATSQDIIFEIGAVSHVILKPRKPLEKDATVRVILDDPEIVETIGSFSIQKGSVRAIFIPIHSKDVAGHCVMSFKSKSEELKYLFKTRIKIKVVHEILFGYLSIFLGWAYFVSWGLTYYPQFYQNWKRRSVVGLSFDYLALSFTGHFCYCVFNAAMYWNTYIQRQYTKLHPKGELPVKANDNTFSLHATIATSILIVHCFVYDRGEQKISVPILTLTLGIWLTIVAGIFAAIMEKMSWMTFLYYLVYIKVATVPMKYTPQVHLNYTRKCTEGWSVHSVMLDMGGGVLSFTQMAVDAMNNDDWDGTLGNPGKLGLGIIAMLYNAVFLIQHFCLYGNKQRKRKNTEEDAGPTEFRKKLEDLKAGLIMSVPLKPHHGKIYSV